MLTSFDADDKVFPAIRAGALGYTLKDFGPAELVRAIQRVHRGDLSLHPTIARKVLQELAHPPAAPTDGRAVDGARGRGAALGGAWREQPGDRRSAGHWRPRCASISAIF